MSYRTFTIRTTPENNMSNDRYKLGVFGFDTVFITEKSVAQA